ncbi:MAG: YggS family pyridoxal phosphate-dependent enzyme [Eubacteriaceae bacterium]|jgi:pyridoxal phosphate enzyme (YggS family)|nr:YggS family pyridoxal phosphate-dependent enzyme [Eubacteriaceae bacterium]
MIQQNIDRIYKKINEIKSSEQEVLLVAVSKYRSIESMMRVYEAGVKDVAENRVQEFLQKYDQLPKDITWHLIGHLQTNKVKYVVGKVALIHSLDSLRLAEEIQKQSEKQKVVTDVLIQINIADEASKFGFQKEEVKDAIEQIKTMPNIYIKGLMCIAPLDATTQMLNNYFKEMKTIYENLKVLYNDTDRVNMHYLSMGMSGDFELAVQNGANLVRIGSAIFEE